ncbi:CBD9-like protein [Auricularia subglabra TFB-10046 SS5]|nr:CBD9-like protein [Auricularia subglabra TFB-10046 SS5]
MFRPLPVFLATIWLGLAAAQGSSTGSSDSSSTFTEPVGSQPTGTPSGAQGSTGGNICMQNLMCIAAVVNSTTTTYVLTAKTANPGYMAMGFGTSMIGSPMVIMWANDDGTITLSQRQASEHAEPKVAPNPPRVATLDAAQSNAQGDLPTFAYTIETQPGDSQQLIWAYGDKPPSSSAPDATLQYHKAKGAIVLNVSQPGGASAPASGPGAGAGSATTGPGSQPTGGASSLIAASLSSFVAYAAAFGAFVLAA